MATLFEAYGLSDTEAPKPPPKPESAGVLRTAGDIGVKTAQGAVDLGQSVVGLASLATGGAAGKGMRAIGYDPEATNQALGEYLSPAQREAEAKVASAEGLGDTVVTALQNPRAIMGSAVESLPAMLAGGGVASLAARRIALKAAAPLGGLSTPAGAEAGAAAVDAAGPKLAWIAHGTEGAQSAGQIADQGQAAGKDFSTYAPAAVGAGAGTALIGRGAGKVMGDAETALFTGARGIGIQGSLPVRAAKGVVGEGLLEEMPQSAQEQVATNIATGKQWDEGVGNAAGMGAVTGGAMGASMGSLQKHHAAIKAVEEQYKPALETAKTLRESGETEAADILTKSVNAKMARDSAGHELAAMATAAPDAAFHQTPEFQQQYQALRQAGGKPAESAGRAAIEAGFQEIGQEANLQPAAVKAVLDAVREKPLDEVPGILEKFTRAAHTRGLSESHIDGISDTLEARRDEALHAVTNALYGKAVDEEATNATLERMHRDAAKELQETRDFRPTKPASNSIDKPEVATESIAADAQTAEPTAKVVSPQFTMEMRPTGTMAVTGDAKAIREHLKAAGINSVLPMPGGIMVGKSKVEAARAALEKVNSHNALNDAAHEAATSPNNDLPEPTQAQKEAGNYKKGHVRFAGLDMTVENPVGSTRSGTDPGGKPWEVGMTAHYGYLLRTEGADGEHVDSYLAEKPHEDAPVYVFDQHDAKGFDEHKVVLGVQTQEEAERLYDAHFSDGKGPDRRKAVRAMTVAEFREWLKSGDTKAPIADHLPATDGVQEAAADSETKEPVAQTEPAQAAINTVAPENARSDSVSDTTYAPPADVAAALEKLGMTPAPGNRKWAMPTKVGSLGDVELSFDPETNEATIEALHMGKVQDTTKAKGAAAIAAAVERARDGIDAGVMEMARRVAANRVKANTEEATTKPKKPNRTKQAALDREKERADYFASGNVVNSYGGQDEVLAYNAPADLGGSWSVKVHEVRKVGDQWIRQGKPQDARTHSTQPEARELAKGPIARLGYQPASEVVYSQPRADGKPFPNAADRGVAPEEKQATAPVESAQTATEVVADTVSHETNLASAEPMKDSKVADDFELHGDAVFARGGEDGKSSVLSANGKFKGWPKFNAWTRSEYNDVVSLLPQEYREDSHRREPLSAKDRDAHATAAISEIEELNKSIGDKGFGIDGLGNLTGDMRNGITTNDLLKASDIADKHGMGVFVTGVKTASMQTLKDAGFVSELGLGGVLSRVTRSSAPVRPIATGLHNNPAYGTMMSYKPRGFAMPMFARSDSDESLHRGPGSFLSTDVVKKAVQNVTAKWQNGPAVHVVDNFTEVPGRHPADIRGLYQDGAIWIVAGAHRSSQQVAKTLAHEAIAHYGLRGALGRDGWHKLTHNIQLAIGMGNTELREISAEIRKLYVDEHGRFNLSENLEADEIAAAVVERAVDENGHFKPGFGFVKEAYAQIIQWLRDTLGISVPFTMAELHGMLVSAQRHLEVGVRTQGAGRAVVAAARDVRTESALQRLSREDNLYALPKSDAKSIQDIVATTDPMATVRTTKIGAETMHTITFQDGSTAKVWDRPASPYGNATQLYGADFDHENQIYNKIVGRPGENPEDVPEKGDVWIDVSLSKPGKHGADIYNIAANYAHNNDKVFIGDPSGLTDAALRRRTEQMISSAIKFGTTDHLAPHPRQTLGSAEAGVPALKWVYGDHEGNVERMIDVAMKSMENAFPDAKSAFTFDPATGNFLGGSGRVVARPELAGKVENSGGVKTRAGVLNKAEAGWRTLARYAVYKSLLEMDAGKEPRRGGLLDRLGEHVSRLGSGDATERVFYARGGSLAADPREPSSYTAAARNTFNDFLATQKSFDWWNNTVGTQYHKAQKDKDFKRAFDATQDYIGDVSRIANDAADLARNLLPKLEHFSDILKHTKRADVDAIAKPIFQGTLEDKREYRDEELQRVFGLTEKQVGLYREFRAATNKSLDDLTTTTVAKLLGNAGIPNFMFQQELDSGQHAEIADAAQAWAKQDPKLQGMADQLKEISDRATTLKAEGYAPLMRFGQYAVGLRDAKTNALQEFHLFESEREANKKARELADQGTVEQSVMSTEDYKLLQGVSPESIQLFGDILEKAGLMDAKDEVLQTYLRQAVDQRSAMKRMIHRQGYAGYTQDVRRVLATFVTSNARLASKNLHFTDMLEAVENIPKTKGDVRDEATKMVHYVQNPVEEASKLRGLLFVNFIGGSVASAITNMTQSLTMTLPYLSQYSDPVSAAVAMGKAMKTAAGTVKDPELATALARAEQAGVVSPQEIHHLNSEAMATFGSNPVVQRAMFLWGSLFSAAEQFNRRAAFIAGYNMAKEGGETDPYEFARKTVEETQGVYNKGNRPNWARGAVGATLFTFKQFSIQYLEFLSRLPKREQALALAILMLSAGAEGLPFADDIDDIIDTIAQRLGYNFNTKLQKRKFIGDTLGEGASDFLLKGISTVPGMPIDVSARMGMANLIPGTGMLRKDVKDHMRDVMEFAGPAGGLVQNAITGSPMKMAPTAIQNLAKGIDMFQTGMYRDDKGRKVVDTDAAEALVKGIGFQPADVGKQSMRSRMINQDINLVKARETEIADRIAQARFEGNIEAAAEARQELRDWNTKNPEARIVISDAQITKRLTEMRKTKDERIIRSAPKEMRGTVRAELN